MSVILEKLRDFFLHFLISVNIHYEFSSFILKNYSKLVTKRIISTSPLSIAPCKKEHNQDCIYLIYRNVIIVLFISVAPLRNLIEFNTQVGTKLGVFFKEKRLKVFINIQLNKLIIYFVLNYTKVGAFLSSSTIQFTFECY